jgi:hypothetical protein
VTIAGFQNLKSSNHSSPNSVTLVTMFQPQSSFPKIISHATLCKEPVSSIIEAMLSESQSGERRRPPRLHCPKTTSPHTHRSPDVRQPNLSVFDHRLLRLTTFVLSPSTMTQQLLLDLLLLHQVSKTPSLPPGSHHPTALSTTQQVHIPPSTPPTSQYLHPIV